MGDLPSHILVEDNYAFAYKCEKAWLSLSIFNLLAFIFNL